MSNTTLTASVVAKAALAILENEMGALKTFHRAYEDEWGDKINGYKIGSSLTIRRPPDFTVRTGATLSTQDVSEGYTTLTINQQIGIDFQFTSQELTLQVSEMAERIMRPAMVNLISYMINDCTTVLKNGTYHWVGTPGTTLTTFAGFAKAMRRMDDMAVPQSDRTALLGPGDFWGLTGAQTALYMQDVAKTAYRQGELGNLGGVSTQMSQFVPTHTVGALGGTPAVNGANQNVTYAASMNTWTQSLITNGWTASVTGLLNVGDVFTIANVHSVNPLTKVSTGALQQFVVTAAANSDISGNATLTISPPIISSGVRQTVDNVPGSTAAITVLGTAATGYANNLVYHKNAFALAVVPMEMPQAAYGGARESYKGLSVRVIPIYDGTNDISKWRLDLLYGRSLIDPRMSVRLSGT
ncbi:MAG: hypothetical protein KGP14_08135 [Betaproteobacteria bacterium]|nr:hypothetical protein [Betaproteobacteria bacterium]